MILRNYLYRFGLLCFLLGLSFSSQAADKIILQALFENKAIIKVDGARRVVATGKSTPEGIKLISTNTVREEAVIEIDGTRQVLTLGVVVSGGGLKAGKLTTVLFAGSQGHFRTMGKINGKPVRFLIDTGATQIAMNSQVAKRLAIDYRRIGKPGMSQTASGIVRTYNFTLSNVTVGEITLFNIDASVIEGNYPRVVLLGMSFLGKLEMRRQGSMLELVKP